MAFIPSWEKNITLSQENRSIECKDLDSSLEKRKKETYSDTVVELDNGDIRLSCVGEWPLEAEQGSSG